MSEPPGFVIVTYRCRELALHCLNSLGAQLPGALERTIVVDNASGDGVIEAVRQHFPRVRTLTRQRNVGFAAAANAGIRELADCDVVCVLNPDTMVLDGEITSAAQYLRDHETAGVAGIRIENADGTLQPSCRAFPGHRTAIFNRHSLATRLLPGNRYSQQYLMTGWPHDEVRNVDWVSGACMLIHRRTIERIGLFDAYYFFSIEDVDYCKRAHDAGLAVVFYPMATIQHRVGGSSRHAVFRAMAAHHRGMWRYYRMHMQRSTLLDILTAGGILGRLGIHAISYSLRTAMNAVRGVPNP